MLDCDINNYYAFINAFLTFENLIFDEINKSLNEHCAFLLLKKFVYLSFKN